MRLRGRFHWSLQNVLLPLPKAPLVGLVVLGLLRRLGQVVWHGLEIVLDEVRVVVLPDFEKSMGWQESLMIRGTSLSFFASCRIKSWSVSCEEAVSMYEN